MLPYIKRRLPLIGSICLLILTLVNFMVENEFIVGIVGGSLFIFVALLSIITRKVDEKDKE